MDGEGPACLVPWLENPYGLVSLWDMERFNAGSLHGALVALENTRITHAAMLPSGDATAARLLKQQKFLNDGERTKLNELLAWIENQLRDSGLPTSAEALVDLQRTVGNTRSTLSAAIVAHDLEELQKTIQREMRGVVFLYMPAEDAKRFGEPFAGWESVIDRWPQARGNISESSLCLSLNRYGGAVFHILLVAEFGVIQVCSLFGVCGDRPGWGCVARLEEILKRKYPDRLPIEQRHSDMLRDLVPSMVLLRGARHRITHADNSDTWLVQDIGPNTADEITKATRGFMREIAARLPAVAMTEPCANRPRASQKEPAAVPRHNGS
jgi:hypothetical protein